MLYMYLDYRQFRGGSIEYLVVDLIPLREQYCFPLLSCLYISCIHKIIRKVHDIIFLIKYENLSYPTLIVNKESFI
jgi:hypothetical protein